MEVYIFLSFLFPSDQLYVTGGIDESDNWVGNVDVVDAASGAVKRAPAMGETRAFHSVAVSSSSIFVFGGFNKRATESSKTSCEMFSPKDAKYVLKLKYYYHFTSNGSLSGCIGFVFKIELGLCLTGRLPSGGRGRLRGKRRCHEFLCCCLLPFRRYKDNACAEISLEEFVDDNILLNFTDGPNFQTSLRREPSFQPHASRAIPIIFYYLAAKRI